MTMRANAVRAAGSWRGETADIVVVDYDDRYRRRIAMTGVHGLSFLLDLPEAIMLRSGDALVLDDGRLVEVLAAPEHLTEIIADDVKHLARIAWHLGNRHLPTQILGKKLRIRRDHVIEEMLRGLGAKTIAIEAAFDPEGGAYAEHVHSAGSHDHTHAHHGNKQGASHRNHDHDHDHSAPRRHHHDE